jgi:hypothetical protein
MESEYHSVTRDTENECNRAYCEMSLYGCANWKRVAAVNRDHQCNLVIAEFLAGTDLSFPGQRLATTQFEPSAANPGSILRDFSPEGTAAYRRAMHDANVGWDFTTDRKEGRDQECDVPAWIKEGWQLDSGPHARAAEPETRLVRPSSDGDALPSPRPT